MTITNATNITNMTDAELDALLGIDAGEEITLEVEAGGDFDTADEVLAQLSTAQINRIIRALDARWAGMLVPLRLVDWFDGLRREWREARGVKLRGLTGNRDRYEGAILAAQERDCSRWI